MENKINEFLKIHFWKRKKKNRKERMRYILHILIVIKIDGTLGLKEKSLEDVTTCWKDL